MSCPDREAKLKDWVFEELSQDEVAELASHVQGCASCARTLKDLQQTHQTLAAHLAAKQLPGHLVFLPERPSTAGAGTRNWVASFWRAAAMGAAAAVVFLGITLGGLVTWGNRATQMAPAQTSAFSRTEVEGMIRSAVEQERTRQRSDLEASSQALGAQLRREQLQFRAVVLQDVRMLESAQNAVWKETQEQGAVVQTIARNLRAGQPGVREK